VTQVENASFALFVNGEEEEEDTTFLNNVVAAGEVRIHD
jgi:hypothetical protein